MSIPAKLQELDERFNPALNLLHCTATSPGYHTNIADGTLVHDTRENADYAILCLRSDDPQRIQRGRDVLQKLLSLQDTDPLSPTFGIWSWFYEEPVSKMTPPDWNWADFIGARLLMILTESGHKLPPDLQSRLCDAIERAALSIFRRQAPVSYTNIAIMGAGVCAAAGQYLHRPILTEYGRHKLQAVLALARKVGCFSEFNSPTYTMVAIEECERILSLVQDVETRRVAQELHALAWQMVADHWHQPTMQWAGPHGRAYHDRLPDSVLGRIGVAIGRDLASPQTDPCDLIQPLPCPSQLVQRFLSPLQAPRTVTLHLGTVDGVDQVATTWLAPTCCLSSVSRDHTWDQRRNILAYWHVADALAVFKVQWLMDYRDMPGMRIASEQQAGRILMGLYPLYGSGPFHPAFGIPSDHTHPASDLRLRFLIDGPGARIEQHSASRFDLICGDHRVRVDLTPADFNGSPIQWQITKEAARAMLNGVCIQSPQRVNFRTLQLHIAAALQLLAPTDSPVESPITLRDAADSRAVDWPGSGLPPLLFPAEAKPFSW